MALSAALVVARDLEAVAAHVRERDPGMATRLDHDRELLLEDAHPLTVTAAAELLGQSRQTIHEWLRRGVLDVHPRSSPGKVLIEPRSVLTLLPYVEEWRSQGGGKRALRIILEGLEALETAQLLAAARTDEAGRPVVKEGALSFGRED